MPDEYPHGLSKTPEDKAYKKKRSDFLKSRKKDIDEISSMGGGSVAGPASAGNIDEDEPGGLIREEDIIEQVMKKITSGDYYYEWRKKTIYRRT